MTFSVALKKGTPKQTDLAVFFAASNVDNSHKIIASKKKFVAPTILTSCVLKSASKTFEKLGFTGGMHEKCLVPGCENDFFNKAMFIGLGKIDVLNPRNLHVLGMRTLQYVKELRASDFSIIFDKMPAELDPNLFFENFVIGAHRGAYSFNRKSADAQKMMTNVNKCTIYLESVPMKFKKTVAKADIIGLGANLTRDLINMPAAEATPKKLADVALELGKAKGDTPSPLKVTVFDKKKIQQLKMGGLLGVNQGSHKPPYFIIMDYQYKKTAPTIVLVGKGITFDSGGLNVKEWMGMSSMKTDMGGAATVIGIMQAVRDLKPRMNVVGIVPATENLSGANAYMPGDVLTMYNKKTVEVLNTDAEGRLILADGISYGSQKYKPDYLFDLATLTGACVMALGGNAAGVMTENDEYWNKLNDVADESADRIWRLPIWDEYGEPMKSRIADLQNVGGRWGGASAAGWFLKNFTNEPKNYVHVDIAGMATGAPKGSGAGDASGFGVQLMVKFIESVQ
ncbi:MAG: leucyl aminopeptidase [Planctomycetes bacterium]|nr:leucyl aminopeptidase [Planctomycetota bacterium]